MTEVIAFTKVRMPWGWLGNMSPHPIIFDGVEYPTAEHLFQSMRLPKGHPAIKKMLSNRNPMAAKFLAKSLTSEFIIDQLSPEDIENMRIVIRNKIDQHSDLRLRLIETGERRIIEDVTSRANKGSAKFWGAAFEKGEWVGQNWLGRLWMDLRVGLTSARPM